MTCTNFKVEIWCELKINVGFRESRWPTLIGLYSVVIEPISHLMLEVAIRVIHVM